MKNIKISNYAIYSDGEYDALSENFINLYKGVRVNVSLTQHGIGFSIRTRKKKDTIWVRPYEKIDSIVFNDADCSITCNFDRKPENKSKSVLTFERCVYDDLKRSLPAFMFFQGCSFVMNTEGQNFILDF